MIIDKRKHSNNYTCAVAHGCPYVGTDGEQVLDFFATAHYADAQRSKNKILVAYDEKKGHYLVVNET